MSSRRMFLILMTINIFAISASNAAPYDPDLEINPWVENVPTPIITQPCPAGERCWEWLPPIGRDDDAYLLQEESSNNARLQNQRKIHREVDSGIEQLKEDNTILIAATGTPAPIIRQISPRPVKKDVFMSRSWGPGGLPFSVLYMNPHSARANHPNTGMAEVAGTRATSDPTAGRAFEAPPPPPAAAAATMPPAKHPNYRVALRNGASGQPRRQYSIIPQLFISYGWGPLGK